jgi:hypothetical protein
MYLFEPFIPIDWFSSRAAFESDPLTASVDHLSSTEGSLQAAKWQAQKKEKKEWRTATIGGDLRLRRISSGDCTRVALVESTHAFLVELC